VRAPAAHRQRQARHGLALAHRQRQARRGPARAPPRRHWPGQGDVRCG